MIADGTGRAVAFTVALGQAHELPQAIPLLDALPGVPLWVAADRGYSSHTFREHIRERGATPAIPAKRNEAPVACADWAYNNRNMVKRLWARLKEWRAAATRYEKTATSLMGVLCLAAALGAGHTENNRCRSTTTFAPDAGQAALKGHGYSRSTRGANWHHNILYFLVFLSFSPAPELKRLTSKVPLSTHSGSPARDRLARSADLGCAHRGGRLMPGPVHATRQLWLKA